MNDESSLRAEVSYGVRRQHAVNRNDDNFYIDDNDTDSRDMNLVDVYNLNIKIFGTHFPVFKTYCRRKP